MHSTMILPLSSQAWRHKLVILTLRRTRQDSKFTGRKREEIKGSKQRGKDRTFLFRTLRKWPRKLKEEELLLLWSCQHCHLIQEL